jgi:hypothetical protein
MGGLLANNVIVVKFKAVHVFRVGVGHEVEPTPGFGLTLRDLYFLLSADAAVDEGDSEDENQDSLDHRFAFRFVRASRSTSSARRSGLESIMQ